jgi:glutamyl-tRNA synthetase
LDQSRVEWKDGVLGPLSIDAGSVSDPILIRGDGQYLYTLASVVDDQDFNINYVVRGSDHVTNTATQIQLFKALGYTPPIFAHHSLLVGPSGEPLSKRMNNLSLLELKNTGFEPQAVFIFMACLGGLKHAGVGSTREEVSEGFVLSSFGSAPTKFDPDVLRSFSQKSLSRLSLNELEKQLDELEVPRLLQLDFWNMAKENITRRSDLSTLWRLCVDGAEPVIVPEDKDFLIICKKLLPSSPRDQKSWSVWTTAIKSETGRSGKDLFLPLRKALTGKENGPDMNKLFPLLQQILF